MNVAPGTSLGWLRDCERLGADGETIIRQKAERGWLQECVGGVDLALGDKFLGCRIRGMPIWVSDSGSADEFSTDLDLLVTMGAVPWARPCATGDFSREKRCSAAI